MTPEETEALAESRQDAEFWARNDTKALEARLREGLAEYAKVSPVPYRNWEAARDELHRSIALDEVRLLLDTIATLRQERDEARAERDVAVNDLTELRGQKQKEKFAYWNSLSESEQQKIRQNFHDDMFGGTDD